MLNTKFHCGDIVKVTDFSRYATFIEEEMMDKEIPIVCIHPVTVHGEVDFTDPEIQYFVPSPKQEILRYYALVGADFTKVGYMNYRSIFGRFRYYDLLTMLESPQNPVEEFMFKQCLRVLMRSIDPNKMSADTIVFIRNKIKDSQDYFSGVSKGDSIKITLIK